MERSEPAGASRVVGWGEAAAAALSLGRMRAGRGPVVIGVTGPVGAGKSTLARLLSGCVISTDNYLPDYEKVEFARRDDPAAADLPLLAAHLAALARGEPARTPVWSFHTHRREGVREVAPADVIVCEGIHALHPTVSPLMHARVFVDAAAAVRWRRWKRIAQSGERGWDVEHARRFFQEVAEPTFSRFETEYRARADLIVVNEGD